MKEAKRYRIRVALQVAYAPPWANGGRPKQWAPRPHAYAQFVAGAVDDLG